MTQKSPDQAISQKASKKHKNKLFVCKEFIGEGQTIEAKYKGNDR